MKQTAKLIGGAGTGKTSTLLKTMEASVDKLQCDPSLIGFASFTRAAREEMVDRAADKFDVHPSILSKHGWFRTVHSTCYRSLGIRGEQLLSGDDKSTRWIADQLRVTVTRRAVDDSGFATYVGDEDAAAALNIWDISRNRVVPLATVHSELSRVGSDVPSFDAVKRFVKKYEDAKRLHDKVDFVDIVGRFAGVEFGLDGPEMVEPRGDLPPGVKVWIFDEYQDSSKLVDLACRRLSDGPDVIWTYLAADPFQSVFGFGGADYTNFMSWEVDKVKTMPQSWRCPRPVMELGERCLRRMKAGYFDRGIAPAPHEGSVIREPSIERALQGVDPSRTTLVLARCNYSLAKYATILEQRKIPYARINQDSDTAHLTACNAYWRLQNGQGISGEQWRAAISLTPAKGLGEEVFLNRGHKAAWKDGRREGIDYIHPDEIGDFGPTEHLVGRIRDGRWASLIPGGEKWYAAAKRHGADQATNPNVRLSTIHGSKGMEAQDVVLATETSWKIENAREIDPRSHDEECRIEYVGVTRAKERLIVCESDEPHSMSLPY
jgi:DNA helicase-2/ATP-dependent DNA helicase PcrA